MTIVVTGATGQLGRHVVESLLRRGVPAAKIVATGRDIDRLSDLAARGVRVRAADYQDPVSLREALAGAEKVLLVSGTEMGQREAQHRNVIEAAKAAGVRLLAYTSIANADRSGLLLAAEHQGTEKALIDSGVPYVLLRNGWYLENYTAQLPGYVAQGAVVGSAGDGRVSGAARADYAEAAAAVLVADDQAGKIYELGGDQPFGYPDLATAVSAATGRSIGYRDLPADEYVAVLTQAGIPEPYAQALADSDQGIARGELLVSSGDLARLIGRAATTLSQAVQQAAQVAGLAA